MANGDDIETVEDYLADPAEAVGLLVALRDQVAEHEADLVSHGSASHGAGPRSGFPSDERWRADTTKRVLGIRGDLGVLKAGQKTLEAGQASLEAGQASLEAGQASLEARQTSLEEEVRSGFKEMRAGFRALGLNAGMTAEQLAMFDDPW